MKLLYLDCCHPVLSYDNCITFEDLGIDWFCTGVYMKPNKPLPFLNIRTSINKDVNSDLVDEFLSLNANYFRSFVGLSRPIPIVSKSFVDKFDIIFTTNYLYILHNWDNIKHKPIVWRTSGAINENMEIAMKPYISSGSVYPVRFSKQELLSINSNGGAVIRNFADESIYFGWRGDELEVLSFQSWFTQRRALPINKFYSDNIYKNFNCKLFGAYVGKKDPISRGTITWWEQIYQYKTNRVYFYIGSPVGVVAYNYIEAMMSGCPIVTMGPKVAGYRLQSKNLLLHEPSEFIENEVDGFYSDDPKKVKYYIKSLLYDSKLAENISVKARRKALDLFSKEKAIKRWKEFFNSIGF